MRQKNPSTATCALSQGVSRSVVYHVDSLVSAYLLSLTDYDLHNILLLFERATQRSESGLVMHNSCYHIIVITHNVAYVGGVRHTVGTLPTRQEAEKAKENPGCKDIKHTRAYTSNIALISRLFLSRPSFPQAPRQVLTGSPSPLSPSPSSPSLLVVGGSSKRFCRFLPSEFRTKVRTTHPSSKSSRIKGEYFVALFFRSSFSLKGRNADIFCSSSFEVSSLPFCGIRWRSGYGGT